MGESVIFGKESGEKWQTTGRKVSSLLTGEYSHSIDAKGRLIIPSKFREILGEDFVITKGMDGCLFP